jgi:hypothetical protein
MKCGIEHRVYSLELIKTSLRSLDEHNKSYYMLRSFLPYLIIPQGDFYLPLNRDYKPLGMTADRWVNYEDCEGLFFPKSFFKGELKPYPLEPDGAFFFFADRTTPILTKERKNYIWLLNSVILDNYNTFLKSKEDKDIIVEMKEGLLKRKFHE